MKHSWKCLLLAGVCALLTCSTSAAQTPASQSPSFFRLPSLGSTARMSSMRLQRSDVIQARRQQLTNQSMFSRMGNFIWTLGGLRNVPQSPVMMPRSTMFR